jgi:hypothetical protein
LVPGVVVGAGRPGKPGKWGNTVGIELGSTVGKVVGIPDGIVMGGKALGTVSGSGKMPPSSRGAVTGTGVVAVVVGCSVCSPRGSLVGTVGEPGVAVAVGTSVLAWPSGANACGGATTAGSGGGGGSVVL